MQIISHEFDFLYRKTIFFFYRKIEKQLINKHHIHSRKVKQEKRKKEKERKESKKELKGFTLQFNWII